eukprot:37747-Hanusia_phi.AAC.2
MPMLAAQQNLCSSHYLRDVIVVFPCFICYPSHLFSKSSSISPLQEKTSNMLNVNAPPPSSRTAAASSSTSLQLPTSDDSVQAVSSLPFSLRITCSCLVVHERFLVQRLQCSISLAQGLQVLTCSDQGGNQVVQRINDLFQADRKGRSEILSGASTPSWSLLTVRAGSCRAWIIPCSE